MSGHRASLDGRVGIRCVTVECGSRAPACTAPAWLAHSTSVCPPYRPWRTALDPTSQKHLATRDGVDVLQTLRQGILLPGLPAIVCAKDLPAPGGTVDLLGVLATH